MKAAKAAPEIELDLGRYELRRSGRRVKIEKKPMELLIFLAGRRNQMVPREEIVRRLWRSDLFIDTDRNVNNIVRKIRTALGDNPARPRFLETVVGKGYRFIGPLRVIEAQYRPPETGVDSARLLHAQRSESRGESDRSSSSLAVIPLLLLGNEKDDHGVCLGFADALVSHLGRLENVDVLPTSSVLDMPGDAHCSHVASSLGVRFVVHGAMQMLKGQWRLSVEMFDSHSQAVCLARKYDLDMNRLPELEAEIAKQIAGALNRPLRPVTQQRTRFSRDPLAYAEFMRGYRLSASPNASNIEMATQHLTNSIARDPAFALAHATLSFMCTTRHFEFDPANVWLEKAEFHCSRALELDSQLPEGHMARAFLMWGPAKNFQHLEAIADLKRALSLQPNLPHAYNRLGTILAHIGLLEQAKEMYERGRPFQPRKEVSPSIVQAYLWNMEYEQAQKMIEVWRAASPDNKYVYYFAPQPAMMTGNWHEVEVLLSEAQQVYPEDPILVSLQGVFYARTGQEQQAMDCMARACASPKSFGHAHHTYYQIACILSLLGRTATAFEWLERSVSSGFACWPFFLKDDCLKNLRGLPEFELLVSSLQARYPEHLGLL